jgi:hypothetical protein
VCEPDDGNAATSAKTADFNDPLKRWERFRDASQYENQRMHDRFNWLMISQPVLFTALAFAVKEHKDCSLQGSPLTGIALSAAKDECQRLGSVLDQVELLTIGLGLTISSLALVGLAAAGRKHWQWTSRLITLAEKLNANDESDPTVPFGLKPHWPARTTSLIAPAVALVFVVAWGYLALVLPGVPARWLIRTDVILVLFILAISKVTDVRRWFHRRRARKKSA